MTSNNEPGVQVPLTTLRAIRAAFVAPALSWTQREGMIQRLDDLLSQPTPEPPRIDDMAPGTTFTAAIRMPFVVRTQVVEDQFDGHYWGAEDIDPATIREVKPPQ